MGNIELYTSIVIGGLFIGSEIIAQLPIKENSWLQLAGKIIRIILNGRTGGNTIK